MIWDTHLRQLYFITPNFAQIDLAFSPKSKLMTIYIRSPTVFFGFFCVWQVETLNLLWKLSRHGKTIDKMFWYFSCLNSSFFFENAKKWQTILHWNVRPALSNLSEKIKNHWTLPASTLKIINSTVEIKGLFQVKFLMEKEYMLSLSELR